MASSPRKKQNIYLDVEKAQNNNYPAEAGEAAAVESPENVWLFSEEVLNRDSEVLFVPSKHRTGRVHKDSTSSQGPGGDRNFSISQDSDFRLPSVDLKPLSARSSFSDDLHKPPPTIRKFSVASKKRQFDVTNYGTVEPTSPILTTDHREVGHSRGNIRRVSECLEPVTQIVVDLYNSQVIEQNDDGSNNGSVSTSSLPNRHLEVPSRFELLKKSLSVLEDPTELRSIQNQRPFRSAEHSKSDLHKRLEIAKRGRHFASRKKDRLVDKNGECKVVYSNLHQRSSRFLSDFFTTAMETQWRYHFLIFSLVFAISWVIFGLIWWSIVIVDKHVRGGETANATNAEHVPCVEGVHDFASALLFSIETQHTIGYGTRAITSSCPTAMIILMFQSMYGLLIQCVLTGIIFAKMARPKRRAQTIIFSDKAVICQRDNHRFLMFRVGDMRKSQILGANIQVLLAERRVTKEGEYLPIVTRELQVTTETGGSFFFLAWPLTVVHKIDSESPLWDVTPDELILKDWEFIVVLEGVAEVTGASFQVRSSYIPSEILWGHRLKSLLNKRSGTGGIHAIDYTDFHKTVPIDIPDASVKQIQQNVLQDDQMRVSIDGTPKAVFNNINHNNNNPVVDTVVTMTTDVSYTSSIHSDEQISSQRSFCTFQ